MRTCEAARHPGKTLSPRHISGAVMSKEKRDRSVVVTDPLFSVEGQVVIVSGGSRGIGKAIADEFVKRFARVVITGRNAETLKRATAQLTQAYPASPDPLGIVCDVADESALEPFVSQVFDQFQRIDTLVNCAGVNRRKPALEITPDDYDYVMNINLRGAFLLSQQVGRVMLEQQSGSQINITSLNSDRPLTNVAPYAMSKAAMAQMTRALAAEWGSQGVRVNGLAPGFILTDLTEKLWSDDDMRQWGQYNTPQGRLGRPADLAGTAIFLASRASQFMTGQILYVDGGFTAGWHWPIPEVNQ